MKENEFLDFGLKRLAYNSFQTLMAAGLFTLYYSESLQHFAKFAIAASLNVYALPVVLLTDFFNGLTAVEWYMILMIWMIGSVAAYKTS